MNECIYVAFVVFAFAFVVVVVVVSPSIHNYFSTIDRVCACVCSID